MENHDSSSERAVHFKKARLQRLCELAEDYTEMIADLLPLHGKVRVCDLAREMGVSHVGVLKAIKKLIRDGYLVPDIQPHIELTEKGKETAAFAKKKHLVLSNFLHMLGIPESIIASDVEGIEHHISPTTLEALEKHLETFAVAKGL